MAHPRTFPQHPRMPAPAPWTVALAARLDAELASGSLDNPFRPVVLRWASTHGRAVDPAPLLERLETNRIGGRSGSRRYRWTLPSAGWLDEDAVLRWRPAEAESARRHREEHAARLWVPPILTEHVEWLERVARSTDGDHAARARALLVEATPTLEDDVARHVMGQDPWADTFMLWVIARRARALTHVRGLASAIASRYAARAARSDGLVLGLAYPFFGKPMPSATAHLASAAARIGDGIEVVAPAVEWLAGERRGDGGWGDPGQPSDILTTLAVAELLGHLDPRFDPSSALERLEALVADGDPRPELIGPEWAWVAVEVLAFVEWCARPFRERFRWPHLPGYMTDDKVGVPRYEAYLVDARLFARMPGLSAAPVEIGFLDMAGFGAWNTAHGQAAGDELLALLTSELRRLPESRTIRDGGDEFLVVGAPEATGLEDRLRAMFGRWTDVSRERYPDLPVVPLRAAVTVTRADGLRTAREQLGRWIGEVKHAFPDPPPEGVVVRYEAGA
jgi:GGDEF domain-containing protein